MTKRSILADLLATARTGPCISIYLKTHRHHPDNQQDPIRFRNLVRQASDSLARAHSAEEVADLLAPFHTLADDTGFWAHTSEALAVFGARGLFHTVLMHRQVPELAIVADSFHVKPLLRILQSADRFQILSVNRHDAHLYEGNRDVLHEIELAAGVPRTIEDVRGDDLPEPQRQVHSYGGGSAASGAAANRAAAGAKSGGIRHGHGAKSDVIDQQTESFFEPLTGPSQSITQRPQGCP